MKNVEQERENPSLSTAEVLHNLVVEQRRELEGLKDQAADLDLNSWKALRDWHKQTGGFSKAYNEAMRYTFAPHTQEDLNWLRDHFAGKMFQDIAFTSCALSQPQDCILLSPEKTLEFWEKLYPKNRVIKSPFGLDSIEGISVPDGMVVNEQNDISEAYEYTLSIRREYFSRSSDAFKISKGDFPELFENTPLVFVAPKHLYSRHTTQMPFTQLQFRVFMDDIYEHYMADRDYSLTLNEIGEWSRAEKNNVLDRVLHGDPTDKDLYYFFRNQGRLAHLVEKHPTYILGNGTEVDVSLVDFTSTAQAKA